MGGKGSKAEPPAFENYEQLAKAMEDANIHNDMGVIVFVDAKGDATPNQKKDGKLPDKMSDANSLQDAMECSGHLLSTDEAFVYIFGSKEADGKCVPLRRTRGATELLARFHGAQPAHNPSEAKLSLKSIVEQAIKHADQTRQFHLVVIFVGHDFDADINEQKDALKLAARYPLSIVIVKTGSGPTDDLKKLANNKGRFFDNVTLVAFESVAEYDEKKREDVMGVACMHRIPGQYQTIRKKQAYMPPAEIPVFDDPMWEHERRYQESLKSDAKLLVLGEKIPSGRIRVGRGAFWDGANQQLLFTDLLGRFGYVLKLGKDKSDHILRPINAMGNIGFIVPDSKGNIYVGTESGIEIVRDIKASEIGKMNEKGEYWVMKFAEIDKQEKSRHLTCGTVDAKGRVWVCTGDKEMESLTGGVFCCHGEGKVFNPVESGLSHYAGIAFSLDGKHLFAANQHSNNIWVYNHDTKSGVITQPRVLFEATKQVKGIVSDVAVDSDGKLWVPHWGGGAVVKYDPVNGGQVLQIVRIPTLLPSSIAFGGPELKHLFVITGCETVNTNREYYAGSVFVVEDVGSKGSAIRAFVPT